MKALVFNGPRNITYESFADPELKTPNSVIIKVRKCSICGSDLHMYHGDTILKSNYGADVEKFCVGHEFIGEVMEVGPHVHSFKTGDQVLSSGGTGCGKCQACVTGDPLSCPLITAFGIGPGMHGGQAEFVCVPNADNTLLKTEGLSDEQSLLLTDAMATAYYGVSRADISPGDRVTVVGLGPIGLIGIELAFLMGASKVFAIDPVESRRKMAEKRGAIALEPGRETVGRIRNETEGLGTECVFEASGATAAINSVLKIVRPNGTASFIGIPQQEASLSMSSLLFKNVTVRGGTADVQNMWPALLPLVRSDRIKAEGLFSHNFELSAGSEAYRLFDSREDGVTKIMISV